MDAAKASYGISNYLFATTQLAQTTMRSEMGKLDLDRSFEERSAINAAVVAAGVSAVVAAGVESRTSRLRAQSAMQWRSRCVPSVRSAQ